MAEFGKWFADEQAPLQPSPQEAQPGDWFAKDLTPVINNALDKDPEKENRARQLSELTGVPKQAIANDLESFERILATEKMNGLLSAAPITKEFMSNPDNADISHDDVKNLTDLETKWIGGSLGVKKRQIAKQDPNSNIPMDVIRALGAGALYLPYGAEAAGTAVSRFLGIDTGQPVFAGQTSAERMEGWRQLIADTLGEQKALMPEVTQGIVSSGQTLASLLTKAPLSVMGTTTGGVSAEQASQQGATPGQALIYGAEQGAVEALTEKLPVENLLKALKGGSPFFQTLVKQLAFENVTEQIATAWQDMNEWLMLNPEKTVSEYLEERPNAALNTLITTTISTGITTATSHVVVNAVHNDTEKAKEATVRADWLDDLKKTYDISLLRQRAPEAFVQHQHRVLEKAGIDTVYIDSDGFAAYGWKTDPETGPLALAKQFGISPEAVEQAITSGTDISLTKDQFIRQVMMSQDYADMAPHIRFDPSQMTKAEAENYKKSGIQEEVERAMAAKAPVEGADIVVYHGTPYDFLEFSRQDTEGTGEGSASFGSGIYVAEARGVSEYYKNLANNQLNLNDLPQALKDIYGPKLDEMKARQADIYNDAKFAEPEGKAALRAYTQDMIKLTDEIRSKMPTGNIFESKLRVKQDELLDLDATLGDMPQSLQDKILNDPILKQVIPSNVALKDQAIEDLTGDVIYKEYSVALGGDQAASKHLLSLGIQGNKFLDQLSRERGYGTSNYVVFDPARLTITKKNDVEIEEVIALAEAELGLQGLFTSAAEAGMTSKQYEAYLRKVEDARIESVKRQKDKVLKQQLREKDAEWKEEWSKVEEQVRSELGSQQVYQAVNNIGRERLDQQLIRNTFLELIEKRQATKKDIDTFLEMLPEDEKGRKIYTPANLKGIDPQTWAEAHGYDSAVEMLQDMMTVPEFKDAVRDNTQKIMDVKFGSLKDARLALVEARESLHNEDKLDMLTLELNALQEAKKGRKFKAVLLRQAARDLMGKMAIKEVSPNKFLAAEKREGRKAGMALRRGVYDKETKKWSGSNRYEAGQAKFRQVINFVMAREAYKAERQLTKDLKYLKKFLNRRKKFPSLPADSLDVIREILTDYRLGPKITAKKKRDLTAWAHTVSIATGTPLTIPARIAAEDSQKFYKDMKLDEFNELVETIKHIEHAGKTEGQFLDAFRKQNVATTVERIKELIQKNLPFRKTDKESRLNKESKVAAYIEAISNADTMLSHIDGGGILGEAYSAIKRPYDRAMSEGYHPGQKGFSARDRDNSNALKTIFARFTQKERAHMDDKLLIPGLREPLSHGGYLSVMLNSGTSGNIAALVESGQFTPAEIRAIHNYASEKDWDFVQEVWDYLDSFWPEVAEAERRRKGYSPEKVEATPINTPFGPVRGGYYPLRYDANLQDIQSQSELQALMDQARLGSFVSSQTRRGYTIERTSSGGRPVMLDLGVLFSHTHSMLYDLEVGDAVNDVFKVLYNPAMKQAFIDQGQKHKLEELQLWFGDVVTGEIHLNNMTDKWLRHLRSGFTISKLGLNIANAFVQPVGLVNTAQLAGKYNTAKALLTTIGRVHRQSSLTSQLFGQESIYREILNKSGFMRSRDITFNRDINDAFETLSTTWIAKHTPEQVRDVAKMATFYFTKKAQMFTDVVSWQAGYNQAKSKGKNEKDAIEHADRVVARSQSSSIFGERSRFERGTLSKNQRQTEIARSFTAMAAFFIAQTNVTIQRTRELKGVKHAVTNPLLLANYMVDQAMVYVIGAILSGWYYWPDDPEEEKDTAKWIAGATLANFANGLPFIREASSAVQGFDTGGVIGAVAGAVGRTGAQGWNLLWEGADAVDKTAVTKNIINLIGVFGQLPTNQLSKTIGAVSKAQQGEETNVLEYVFGAKR